MMKTSRRDVMSPQLRDQITALCVHVEQHSSDLWNTIGTFFEI
jgi:hypothetical protein